MYKNEKHWVRAQIAPNVGDEETEAWLRISEIMGVYVRSGKTFAVMATGAHYLIHARVEDVLDEL